MSETPQNPDVAEPQSSAATAASAASAARPAANRPATEGYGRAPQNNPFAAPAQTPAAAPSQAQSEARSPSPAPTHGLPNPYGLPTTDAGADPYAASSGTGGAQGGYPGAGAAQAPYGVPQSGHHGAPAGFPGAQPARTEPNFFQALLDLEFRQFVTPRFISLLYILAMVFSVIGYIASVFWGFYASTAAGLGAMVFGLIGLLVSVVVWRVILEFVVATIRTAQNTTTLVDRSGR